MSTIPPLREFSARLVLSQTWALLVFGRPLQLQMLGAGARPNYPLSDIGTLADHLDSEQFKSAPKDRLTLPSAGS